MKQKINYAIFSLIIIFTAINIYLITVMPKEEVKPDSLQYYGQIVSVEQENNQKILRVKEASSPYPQHDNTLEGEVDLVSHENIELQMRAGPSNEKPNLGLGDLTEMYEDLEVGDHIAFTYNNLIFENRKEIDKVIFTGN